MTTGCTPLLPVHVPVAVLRDVANVGNAQMRRCRIGKVREKQPAPIHRPTFGPMTSEDLMKQLYPAWGMQPVTTTGGFRC